MRFNQPYWLLAGMLTSVVLIVLWRWHDIRQRAALANFVAEHLRLELTGSVSGIRRFLQRALFVVSMLCLFAAVAGPELGYYWEKISRRGNEVIFAIDTSRSMLTPDIRPNRLTRAKLAIDDMARQLEGDGVGIVAFAGSAFLVCPLTLDSGAFHQSLDAIDIHTIPQGGTNIPSAIEAARAALRRRPGSDRILILVTDGENLEGDALTAAQEAAKQDGLKIYTVGVGTADGDLIPLPADQGGGVVKDEAGALVKSHLDEAGLKAIATATGGAYVHLEQQGDDFETFLRTVFGTVSKHDLVYRQRKIYIQRYQWPLAASLATLLASMVVGTRRRVSRRSTAAVPVIALTAMLGVIFLPTRAESADQTAATPAPGTDSKAPRTQYNAGTSAYRAGNFSQASQAFQKSIKAAPASDSKRLADQEDAYYNLGNALYRAGQQSEKNAPQEAIKQWTDAVKAYDTALQLRPNDTDSKYNRDFVQHKIDGLRNPPPNPGGGGGGSGGGGGGGGGGGNGGGGGGQGNGQGKSGQSQGNPPPQGSGAPQGQPPPAQGQPQQQGGQPKQSPGQPQQQPARPQQQQGQPQQAQPQQQQGQPQQQQGQPDPSQGQPQSGSPSSADNQGTPGQMTPEEARELLDSAKSDEHQSLAAPVGPRDPKQPDKPVKNW